MTIPLRHISRQTDEVRPPGRISRKVRSDETTVRPIPAGSVRLGFAKEIVSLLYELGADPNKIITAAGLDPHEFQDGNNAVPFAALGRLLGRCVACTGCADFGLRVGQKVSISRLGLLGGLMQHSRTVGDALGSLVRHFHLQDRGAAPLLSVDGEVAMLAYAVYDPGIESADQISDAAIATCLAVMRALCGPEWIPAEVLLPRCAPSDPFAYGRLFGAPVRFNEEVAALVFPATWLPHRIADAKPMLHELLANRIEQLEAVSQMDLRDELRRILRFRLLRRNCSATKIADLFSIHRRTLNRRLSAEGTGFRVIVDEMRFEIARQILADTAMPLSQVSAVLAFSEASAFTRAFRRWSGVTPTAWRAQHRGA